MKVLEFIFNRLSAAFFRRILPFMLAFGILIVFFVSATEDDASGAAAASSEDVLVFFSYSADPAKVEEALSNVEDLVVGADAPLTVQVRTLEDFPSVLHPGQRIALFLELPAGFKGALTLSCKPKKTKIFRLASKNQLEMLFNKTILYREEIGYLGVPYCFIPSDIMEPGTNILEIRNNGSQPFAFSRFEVNEFRFPDFSEKSEFKADVELPPGVKDMAKKGNIYSNNYRERPKAVNHIQMSLINYFYWINYKIFDFDKFIRSDDFFDFISGKPLETWFAALRMRSLYSGNPIRLPCNLVLSGSDSYLHAHPVAYICVANFANVLTFQCTALYGHIGEEADLTLPVPWEGESKIQIADGIIPKEYSGRYENVPELKFEESNAVITGGVFRTRIRLSSSFTLRLSKPGHPDDKTWLEIPKLPAHTKPVFKKGLLSIAKTFEPAEKLRFETGGELNPYSRNYEVAVNEIDATKGEIYGIKNIVPYNNKSRLVKISYPDGTALDRDGVDFRYAGIPENYDEFCFWIYPRLEPGTSAASKNLPKQLRQQKVFFQIYLDDVVGKRHFLAVDLEPDKWQRVVLPSKSVKLPPEGRICIVGDPKLPEYKDGGKVSFELNSIYAIGDEHPDIFQHYTLTEAGKIGLKTARVDIGKDKSDQIKIIISGLPNKYFEFRHRFAQAVEIEKINELSSVRYLKYVYRREAQLLEISGFFPLLRPWQESDEFTPEERMGILPDNNNPYQLSAEARKYCTKPEIDSYEKGERSILVIRAVLK